MKSESEIIADLKAANVSLKARNSELEKKIADLESEKAKLEAENFKSKDRIADLEEIMRRLKAKNRPPENAARPGITRVKFGG
jgi:cell division protein FtsB